MGGLAKGTQVPVRRAQPTIAQFFQRAAKQTTAEVNHDSFAARKARNGSGSCDIIVVETDIQVSKRQKLEPGVRQDHRDQVVACNVIQNVVPSVCCASSRNEEESSGVELQLEHKSCQAAIPQTGCNTTDARRALTSTKSSQKSDLQDASRTATDALLFKQNELHRKQFPTNDESEKTTVGVVLETNGILDGKAILPSNDAHPSARCAVQQAQGCHEAAPASASCSIPRCHFAQAHKEAPGHDAYAHDADAVDNDTHDAPSDAADYEKQRDERIRRNMEMLASMGLLNAAPSTAPKNPSAVAKKAKSNKCSMPVPAQPHPMRRRSGLRSFGTATGGNEQSPAAGAQVMDETSETLEPPAHVAYKQSALSSYVCSTCHQFSWCDTKTCTESEREMIAVDQVAGCFADVNLNRIYSLDARGELIAAAGKDGQAAIFGIPTIKGAGKDDSIEPLLSCKLHSGWISDIQFFDPCSAAGHPTESAAPWALRSPARPGPSDHIPTNTAEQLLLLSAGNDGIVALWDVSKTAVPASGQAAASSMPRQLCKCSTLHTGGIFSMHEVGGRILTASKDATVAVSNIIASGAFATAQHYTTLFSSVVKCCRWQDANVFAAGGNDRLVAVVDTRLPTSSPASSVPQAHCSPINSLSWNVWDSNLFVTASNDPFIKLWDLRNLSAAVHSYQGHALTPRIKGIYNPVFLAGGAVIATGGDKSSDLTLYCIRTGRTISRGNIGFTPDKLHALSSGSVMLATRARSIMLLTARWK